jgi:hypothetical protein
VAKVQHDTLKAPDPDLLAAVVLHTLVADGRRGIAVEQVASACERDPDDPADRREIEAALDILLDDGLAQRDGADDLFAPTRAAIRASELSF